MNYSTVVVDDSHIHRVATSFLIKSHPLLDLKASFDCPLEGIRYAIEQQVDLIFLDVLYEEKDIFKIIEELHLDIDIIFNSSWAHFQKETVRFSTSGFLKKPMRRLDFTECVNKWIYQKEAKNHYII